MKLLITRKIPEAALQLLREYPEIEIDYRTGAPLYQQELMEAIKGVDAVIPVIPDQITKEILEAGQPKLKLVAHYAVGYDNIDVDAATKLGIYVSNTPGNLTESVAEFSLGLMFAISKKIVIADKYTREGEYEYWDPMIFLGPTLMNKTLGIVGLGRIGTHLARICHKGLNMKILYTNTTANQDAENELGAKKVELSELLENSDFVSINCPLTKDTHNLIGEKELRQMKPTAYLINTARGPIVSEPALYKALKENWIEGAAIDVFEKEPKLYEGLAKLENIVVTPHIASATREARIQMGAMVANNVIDVLIKAVPPTNLVNTDLAKNKVSSLV
jgi:glyoxylate reductase